MEMIWKNLKGFLFALLLFIIMTLAVSAVVKFTPAPERWAIYYMIGVLCISCLFLGMYFGNHYKKRGFLYGALYSIIFLLVLSAIYMLAFATGLELGLGMTRYIIPMLFGCVGGMIGVNMRS